MAVQSSSKKWMLIGGGVIVAAALVVFFQNYPPQSKDAAGTIGAAQRYHEPQITGADVNVSQDALTTWIQSETFDRILKDPEARRLFADGVVARKFRDEGMKLQMEPDKALVLAEGDTVKVNRLVAPDDAIARRMKGPDDAKVVLAFDKSDAIRLAEAPGLDPAIAKTLKMSFDGVNANHKLNLDLAPDAARGVQLALDGLADGSQKHVELAADAMRGLTLALEQARTLELIEDNAALKAAFNDLGFVRALADSGLENGLVKAARNLELTGEPN